MLLINLKFITVGWLFKMAEFVWVNFNCPPVCIPCLILIAYAHEHQLHEFAIYTSSQDGNERWELIWKLVRFTGVHFSDLETQILGNLSNMKLDLNTSTKVKFSAKWPEPLV